MSEENVFDFKISSMSAVNFILVYDEKDLDKRNEKCVFKPEMSHQIFGENESIFGYKDLRIDLYYLHNSSKCYLNIKHSGVVQNFPPDDLIKSLDPWLPNGYVKDLDEFRNVVKEEKNDQIFGEVIHEFNRKTNVIALGDEKLNCTYKVTFCDKKTELFHEYHQRFETFIIWFIDAANFLDLDDERWIFYYIYEEFKHPENGQTFITPIGFASIYKFFSYPSSSRARISQFFILPTHQKQGLGSKFYKAIHEHIIKMDDIVDITVEEPNDLFQKMRDLCDSLYIYNDLRKNGENIAVKSPKILYNYMAKHKICKKQAVKISDILQYYAASKSGENEEKVFVDKLFKRIQAEFERNNQVSKKTRKALQEELPDVDETLMVDEIVVSNSKSKYLKEIKDVVSKLKIRLINDKV